MTVGKTEFVLHNPKSKILGPDPDDFAIARHQKHTFAVPDAVFKSPRIFMAGRKNHGSFAVDTIALDAFITK